MKVKVIDIDVAKLDYKAAHLVIFHKGLLSMSQMRGIAKQLEDLGVKAVYGVSADPQNSVKVYEIPKEETK